MKVKMSKVVYRDFLGANRYTNRGGIVRPAGETLHFPFGSLRSRTLLFTLCLAKIRRAELSQVQRLPCCHISIVLAQRQKKGWLTFLYKNQPFSLLLWMDFKST